MSRLGASTEPIATVLRARKQLAIAIAVGTIVPAIVTLGLVPRRYEASLTIAGVGGSKQPGLGLGSLAALSGLGLQQGLATTPDLVQQVVTARRVLGAVGRARWQEGTVGEAMARARDLPDWKLERAMRRVLNVSVDRRTSLITISVRHRDSALARFIAGTLIDSAGDVLGEMLRSQARGQRLGLEARVDTMRGELRRSELDLVAFLARNRVVAEFSREAVERERLVREVGFASQAYSRAVTEREAAFSRELEETPVLAILDPLPRQLQPVPRYTAFYMLAGAVVAGFGWLALIFLRNAIKDSVVLRAAADAHARGDLRAS